VRETPVSADRGAGAGPTRFALLASALAGRALEVAAGAPGTPAWTDGRTIFVDPDAGSRDQLVALAVQASLIAAGSLEPDVVRRLAWRRGLARRYLSVEGHRALAENERLLPRPVRSLVDWAVAARGDSPAASLAVALGREAIASPPDGFGAIRVRRLLASRARGDAAPTTRADVSRQLPGQVAAELEEGDDEIPAAADLVSSPVGGVGAVGRFLRQALGAVRQVDGGGPPGADAPTHRGRAGRGAGPAHSTALPGAIEEAAAERRGTKYPEWDMHRRRYRHAWCTVHEVGARPSDGRPPVAPDARALRRSLARLGLGFDRCHRQVQGDDLDIDAAVEARVETIVGSVPDEAVYIDSLRRRRDLAVLLLLDVSGSAAERGATGETVHVQQRAAAAALTTALHHLGDRVALYAFRSQGRRAVYLVPVKRFDDDLDTLMMRRIGGLVPGAYSRLGAAIRHGTAVLEDQGGTSRRLLVVLSDGIAYDHGYELTYGAADARRALAEARRAGTGCVCLSVGGGSDVDALRRVFGSAAHATIPKPEQLRQVIGPLFRSALRSADVRRRVSAARAPA
jgi:nitric oxide reductase NorD protein